MIFIRSFLFNLFFYGLTTVATPLCCLAALVYPRWLAPVQRIWAAVNLGALRLICGIRLDVKGLEHVPAGPVIVAPQHQSAMDIFVWLKLLPRGAYVLKIELTKIPLFGWMLLRLGHVAVDRSAGAAALRSLLKEGGEALGHGAQLIIFPEGTRVAAGTKGTLQPGVAALAAHTGMPVVPAATDSGYCWGRNSFIKRPGVVRVVVCPPLALGLRRPALLAELERAWDRGQQELGQSCG